MSLNKQQNKNLETNRDISYLKEIHVKTRRKMKEIFDNQAIKNSTIINKDDLSLLNKVI